MSTSNGGYEYDVFLSYPRTAKLAGYFDFFEAHLRMAIAHVTHREPQIFVDERRLKPGCPWEDELGEALRRSKTLVALWSQGYFRSPWCRAEWMTMTMKSRRSIVGNVAIPVLCSGTRDHDDWPDWAVPYEYMDFTEYTVPFDLLKDEKTELRYPYWHELTSLASEIDHATRQVGDWQKWRVRKPNPLKDDEEPSKASPTPKQ